jgi:Flp pilus assembly protein TadG
MCRIHSATLRSSGRRGHAVVEVALLAPWVFFLFAGALDMGFYLYSALAVENAARVAALHISASSDVAADPNVTQFARTYVCNELRMLPNVGSTCPNSILSVAVPAQPFSGTDGDAATQVTVTYTSVPLIPIPGLRLGAQGQWTFTRSVQMRL